MQLTFLKRIYKLSPKTYWKEILAITMLLFAYLFFRGHRNELKDIGPQLSNADSLWVTIGVVLTLVYIFFQSFMYVKSFNSIGLPLKLVDAAELFLKRNFLSVFLPAGSISSLAYTPSQLRKRGFNISKIHQAGGIYAFVGLLTVFIIAIPVIVLYSIKFSGVQEAGFGIVLLLLMMLTPLYIIHAIKKRTSIYFFLRRRFPGLIIFVYKIIATKLNRRQYVYTILNSLAIEFCGIFHIYIAMLALGLNPNIEACAVAYTISVLLMIVSPFLRGLGAVEISMLFILSRYGYAPAEAAGITLLYRIFEFWLPLVLGFFSFAWRGKQIFIRLLPAFGLFALGVVNLLSVLTPPIRNRVHFIRLHLPIETIHASKLMILFVGFGLLVTSAYLIKGLRSAYYIAIIFCSLSLIGNLTKAFDYEEATLAFAIITVLLISHKEYRIKSDTKWVRMGFRSVLTLFVLICLVSVVGFYFMDKKHFNIDFSWQQSIYYGAKSFLLMQDASLHPLTRFGREFLRVIKASGFLAWGFLIFTFIKSPIEKSRVSQRTREKALELLKEYGNSAVDYFKVYKDKNLFFSGIHDAFIAYRAANGFAVVLEEPVCAAENKLEVLEEFYEYCLRKGLKPVFYRVGENGVQWFDMPGKQKILIGQEAILDLNDFSLSGKDKKSLRNGLNSLQKKGYTTMVCAAPHTTNFLEELKAVSDEWLEEYQKEELIFSQGMFEFEELAKQDIVVMKDADNKVVAFLNIIPDYTPDECTYDLIRKKADAPGGCMDAMIIQLIEYEKAKGCQYLNMGLVPLTGFDKPQSPAEKLIKYASDKMKRFRNYHSLRDFKDKYNPIWENKYLIYDNDFDLLQLPLALNKVMKP